MIKKAQRKKVKLKIWLAWPSGSWKTMSALKLAKWLVWDWTKICVIDTENWSADLYSHLWEYNTITLTEYKPSKYIEAIEEAEKAGMECIIIDSITHEWKYMLDMIEQLTQQSNSKNSYTQWAKATPHHERFVQKILQSPCHIITTVRSKQDYDMNKDSNWRTVIQKVWMKQETRDWFEYELTLSFDIWMNHSALISKDRTALFDDSPIRIDEKVWEKLKAWSQEWI